MRSAAAIVLFALPVFGAHIQIDHVTIAGSHLEGLRRAFTAATGVPTEYGGRHNNRATEMALTSFPDGSYLEFMGIQPDADPAAVAAHVWSKFLRGNAGPCAFALRVPDVSAEAAKLKSAGVAVSAAVRSGRTRPDGVRLDWETSDIGTGVRGAFFPFLIRDVTPRENRVYPAGKPTSLRLKGVALVVIATDDLSHAIEQYRRAFDLALPRRQQDRKWNAEFAWFEGTPFLLAQGGSADSWVARRVRDYGSGPCALVLASAAGMIGAEFSEWFGRKIFWTEEAQFGWRLGLETVR